MQVQDAPPRRPASSSASSRRPVVAGLAAGIWALLVGVAIVTCVVMVAWAVAPNGAGNAGAAWRTSGLAWLGAHLVPLTVGELEVTLLPSGALVLGLLLGRRGGRWAGRLLREPTIGEIAGVVTSGALAYGMGAAGIAWLSGSPAASADPALAMVGSGLVVASGLVWGLSVEARLVPTVRARLSASALGAFRAALAVTAGLLAAGSLLVSVGLVSQFDQVGGTLAELGAGSVGSAAVTLLGLLCLPTMAVWGMALVVGPGFQIGSVGELSAFGGQVDSLPALPVLAAIPTAPASWAPALLLVPVGLGVLAGRIRWGRDLPTLLGALSEGARISGLVTLLVGGMAALASGSLGGGQLAHVGPAVLPVAAAAGGLVCLGFLLEAAGQSVHLWWRFYRADQRALAGRQVPAGDASPDPAPAGPAHVDLTDAASSSAATSRGQPPPGRVPGERG